MTTLLISVLPDGPDFVDIDAPLLHADDLAALRGDGCFETMLLRDGVVGNLEHHSRRFEHSAALLDLPAPNLDIWHRATQLAVSHWTDGEALLRWVYSRGREHGDTPTGWLTVTGVGASFDRARAQGISVITADRGFTLTLSSDAPWALLGAKSLSYAANMAVLRHAQRQGADDAIFLSSDGHVLEGPTSSVVLSYGRTLVTPAPEVGILDGTTVRSLFSLAEEQGWTTERRSVVAAELHEADGLWLVSSGRLAATVRSVDSKDVAVSEHDGEIRDLTTRAATS